MVWDNHILGEVWFFKETKRLGKGAYWGQKRSSTGSYRNYCNKACNSLKMFSCEPLIHFKKDCPHKTQNQDESSFETSEGKVNDKVEAYKLTDFSCKDKQVFISKAVNVAILFSAYSKTIASCEWRKIYLALLLANERKKVKFLPGTRTFKFGARNKIQSHEWIEIPW